MREGALAAALLLAAGLAGSAPGQSAPARQLPRFGTGVDMIRLDVSVTEGGARYVTGLSQSDFAVFEDGQPQQVSFFAREPLPMSLSLLIDCSASMDESLPASQVAAGRFIQALGERDLGQVIQFNDRVSILQDYTADRAALDRAVRSTRASGATSLFTALYVALKGLVALEDGPGPRRQAIVLLSDGEDTASLVTEDQVVAMAREANTLIYAIGLLGNRPLHQQSPSASRAIHFLTSITHETGGQVYLPRMVSELDSVYGQIVEDLRTQYTIGYVSANARRDGRWRRIVVRTPTRDSLQLRHRIGYQAPKG